jgi:hypothetical protein
MPSAFTVSTVFVPLATREREVSFPDGGKVVAVEVREQQLLLRMVVVHDVDADWLPRRMSVVPEGVEVAGARHLWTLIRLEQSFTVVVEEEESVL